MFLFKRFIGWVFPIVASQLFWFIFLEKIWYYWWLIIWLVGGGLVCWAIVGVNQKKHWAFLLGQYISIMIFPALLLTLVATVVFQVFIIIFLMIMALVYYYVIFQKYLIKQVPTWWLTFWTIILGLNVIIGLVVMYGLVEFLGFSFWISALFIGLLFGFFKYFQDSARESSLIDKVTSLGERVLGLNSSLFFKQFQSAIIFGIFTVELFLAVWLLPVVFYVKALLVALILIFWINQPQPKRLWLFWWKWLAVTILVFIILSLIRWF